MKNNIRPILDLCKKLNKYAFRLTDKDLQDAGLELTKKDVQNVIQDVARRLKYGSQRFEDKVILHTGPHHDDIMLGIMPLIIRQLRPASNDVYFNIMTSGFHSVSNAFMLEILQDTLRFVEEGRIEMLNYKNFFTEGYLLKSNKDIHHYLDNVACRNNEECKRGLSHRIIRDMVGIWHITDVEMLKRILREQIANLSLEKPVSDPELNKLKGQEREFEEELVWAYMGVHIENIRHLHLGLYNRKEETFAPNEKEDVLPILEQLREINPDIITVVMDSGAIRPDTHYKVLKSVAAALKLRNEEIDMSHIRVLAFRNVWSTFHPADANLYVPVSLNSCAVFEKAFATSYLTQYKAEFPNPNFDGPFSELAESIWSKQLSDIQLLLGKDYFYENKSAMIRATHGILYLKEMSVNEFLEEAAKI